MTCKELPLNLIIRFELQIHLNLALKQFDIVLLLLYKVTHPFKILEEGIKRIDSRTEIKLFEVFILQHVAELAKINTKGFLSFAVVYLKEFLLEMTETLEKYPDL